MKMRPTGLVALLTILYELGSSSPVYNMQPAYITANIGTTGRNIRNLPCISRKNNQSGVCMFAIDCVKANGTHLGTCIDRFYFGSCCRIEPVHDITENTIDDVMDVREPPHRLSTIKPIITTTTNQPTKVETTTSFKLTTFQSVDTKPETTTPTTVKPITTTAKTTTTTKPTVRTTTTKPSVRTTTTRPSIRTTTTTTTTTSRPKVTITTTSRPKLTTTRVRTTTSTTSKPTTTPIKSKPQSTTGRPRPTTRPKPSQSTVITTKATRKPTISTTKTPTRSTTTKVPTKGTTTKVPTRTTTKRRPITTTSSTTQKPTKTTASTTISTTVSTTTIKSTTESNEIPTNKLNMTSAFESVNGNLATNEIEAEKPIVTSTTIKPATSTSSSLITWSVNDDTKRNTTKPPVITTNATDEDWVPLTTPDGWVLLPSVPANGTTESTMLTTTETPEIESSSSTPVTQASTINDTIPTIPSSTTELSSSTMSTTESTTIASSTTSSNVNMSDFTDVCGRRMYPEARIVGGEKSTFGKWPWQVSLRQWRTSTYLHKCGAALLNENWAITAAHCVDNVPPSDLLLRLGEHDLSTESEPYLHQERRVQIVASHPQFDPRTFEYDLALLRFYEPITFQPNILPVCVPETDENFVGRTAYVTGWGRLYEDGPLPSILQEVSVPVINNSLCESMYQAAGYIEHIPNIFICAGWRKGGFDSCEGDSGGPMVIQRKDKRFMLAGVISWGIGCAEPNQPGVYTRISKFRDWINQILQF